MSWLTRILLSLYTASILGLVAWSWIGSSPGKGAAQPPPQQLAKTARAMLANHLIVASDLGPGKAAERAIGRYTRIPVEAGQVLPDSAVSPTPALLPEEDVLIGLPAHRSDVESGSVNTGSAVFLCRAEERLGRPVRVEAVLCEGGAATCTALLRAGALSGVADITHLRVESRSCNDAAPPAAAPAAAPSTNSSKKKA